MGGGSAALTQRTARTNPPPTLPHPPPPPPLGRPPSPLPHPAHRPNNLMSTKPPSSDGPTLSAWYPDTAASAASPAVTSASLLTGEPNRPLTAHAAAAALAALEPMPLPRGRP